MPTSKRPNGEGQIRQRANGLWEWQYQDGFKPDGKRNMKSVYAKTQAELIVKKRAMESNKLRGEYVEPSKMTVGQWLDEWFRVYGCPRWKPNTQSQHLLSIEKHIKPAIGGISMQKLSTPAIQTIVTNMTAANYANKSVIKTVEPLVSALNQAVELGYVAKNVALSVKKPPASQKEIQIITGDELKMLIPRLPETASGRALLFILHTGLRVGEAVGLRWSDIKDSSFTVRRTACYLKPVVNGKRSAKQELKIGLPKTKNSARVIPLNKTALQCLTDQRKAQDAQRTRADDLWSSPAPDDDYVFSTSTGTVIDPHNLSRTLENCLSSLNLPRRGAHSLRHTFATRAIEAGMRVDVVSKILGHSNIAFTMQMYVHSNLNDKFTVVNALDNLN